MATKKNKTELEKNNRGLPIDWIVFFILIIIGGGVFGYFYSQINSSIIKGSDEQTVLQLEKRRTTATKDEIVNRVNELTKSGKYGSWPIKDILLSADRGNPFIQKK